MGIDLFRRAVIFTGKCRPRLPFQCPQIVRFMLQRLVKELISRLRPSDVDICIAQKNRIARIIALEGREQFGKLGEPMMPVKV